MEKYVLPWKSKFCRGKVSFALADMGHRRILPFLLKSSITKVPLLNNAGDSSMAHPAQLHAPQETSISCSVDTRVHCIKFQVSYHSTFTSLLGYGLSRFSLSCDLVCLKFVFLFFLVRPSSQWFDCKYVWANRGQEA